MAFKRKNPAELQKQMKELSGGNSSYNTDKSDEWNCTRDSAGNGKAIIRFLPGKTEDDLPFIKLVNHGFKANGWYIENCPSTHGDFDACPVCQYLSTNDSYNTNKAEYELYRRKTGYWANILVIKDPANPENEGKVFKWRFGKKIWDKINAQVEVDVDMGETPVDVTCVYEGANFALKIKEVGGYANYDESSFQKPSEIDGINDEDFQNELIEKMHDISSIVSKDKFESKEKLEEKFNRVRGNKKSKPAEQQADDFEKELEDYDKEPSKPAKESKSKTEKKPAKKDDDFDDLLDDLDDL